MLAVKENPASPPALTITPQFAAAFTALEEENRHLAVTGPAGTGKSTFLKFFRGETRKKIAVVAPTGVAALNAGGETIHSFFRLKPTFIPPAQPLRGVNKKILEQLEILVIDEMSMVRADVFSAICRLLQQHGPHPKQLLGGVQLCLVGDPFQLPPIVNDAERDTFFEHFSEPGIKGSPWARQIPWKGINLSEIFRQTDPEFIANLQRMRQGGLCTETTTFFNQRVTQAAQIPEAAIILTPRNATADSINQRKLAALTSKATSYTAQAKGSFAESSTQPAPKLLTLKPGARVMFTKNDTTGKQWVNGTLGTVKSCSVDEVVVLLESGYAGHTRVVTVGRETWKAIRYDVDSKGKMGEKTVGSYEQLPLTLAWATTIHKAQGLTLEQAALDLTGGVFAPGHLYVALSRVRRLEDLYLMQPIKSGLGSIIPR
ncbi:MAG: ATP-dependent RecD-like DNA helicase [Holosporales bacterium]